MHPAWCRILSTCTPTTALRTTMSDISASSTPSTLCHSGKGKLFANSLEGWSNALAKWLDSEQHCNDSIRISRLRHSLATTHPITETRVTRSGRLRTQLSLAPSFSASLRSGLIPTPFWLLPPGSGFYGNLGRNTLIGPGLATWDFSTFKTTTLRERLSLQFRAEIFNLLNRANFNTPNLITFTSSASGTNVSGTAGAISSTSTTSRQIQFGLKLIW